MKQMMLGLFLLLLSLWNLVFGWADQLALLCYISIALLFAGVLVFCLGYANKDRPSPTAPPRLTPIPDPVTGESDVLVDDLFREFSALLQVEAIALGGSRAGEAYDEASDYDVYLYCTAPIDVETRRSILSRYCFLTELGNHFWEYEDNCILRGGTEMDILYRDLDSFCADVASVVEQCQPRNGYTTCMWHNLLTCRILYDRDGRLAQAKERFDVPYPYALKEAILRRSHALLSDSLPSYEGQIQKAAKRGDLVSLNHRTAAFLESYFDLLFALNEQTHPGEKRLVQLCRERCAILPEHFEENLDRLFSHLFSAPERVPEDLRRILTALSPLLP